MVCVYCSSKTIVINSRKQLKGIKTWRRRRCVNCGSVFTTFEQPDLANNLRVASSNGVLRPFLREKLYLSVHSALKHRKTAIEDAIGLCETITSQLQGQMAGAVIKSTDIARVTAVALKRFDKAACAQYEAYHPRS